VLRCRWVGSETPKPTTHNPKGNMRRQQLTTRKGSPHMKNGKFGCKAKKPMGLLASRRCMLHAELDVSCPPEDNDDMLLCANVLVTRVWMQLALSAELKY
jgi:hypothetical protein